MKGYKKLVSTKSKIQNIRLFLDAYDVPVPRESGEFGKGICFGLRSAISMLTQPHYMAKQDYDKMMKGVK